MSADASKRGRASRAKGQRGERQVAALIADLTGWTIKRRVRQHAGDSDLEGVPGWTVEVKDRAKPTLGDVQEWWRQAVGQTPFAGHRPVLFYKRQSGIWRAVWCPHDWIIHSDYTWTVETSLQAWALEAREGVPRSTLFAQESDSRAAEIAQEAA